MYRGGSTVGREGLCLQTVSKDPDCERYCLFQRQEHVSTDKPPPSSILHKALDTAAVLHRGGSRVLTSVKNVALREPKADRGRF